MISLVIPGRLVGLNEYTYACRKNPHAGAHMKKEQGEIVSLCIQKQCKGMRFEEPVNIDFKWIERNGRRDPDNISGFGRKVILDALVTEGVLKDDSFTWVKGFTDTFEVDKDNPRIEVSIRASK